VNQVLEITARTAPPALTQDAQNSIATVGTLAEAIDYDFAIADETAIELKPTNLPAHGGQTSTTLITAGAECPYPSGSVPMRYLSIPHRSPEYFTDEYLSVVRESFRSVLARSVFKRSMTAYSRVVYSSNCTTCSFDTMLIFQRHANLRWASRPTFDPFDGYAVYERADWDGYGAEPISKETVRAARKILTLLPKHFPNPDIAPGADGGVGFEWVFQNSSIRKIFIDVGPGKTWSAYWRLSSGEKGNVPRMSIDDTTPYKIDGMFSRLGVVDGSVRR
jgi:hypothetical protein